MNTETHKCSPSPMLLTSDSIKNFIIILDITMVKYSDMWLLTLISTSWSHSNHALIKNGCTLHSI